jgi:hypothetical protein
MKKGYGAGEGLTLHSALRTAVPTWALRPRHG